VLSQDSWRTFFFNNLRTSSQSGDLGKYVIKLHIYIYMLIYIVAKYSGQRSLEGELLMCFYLQIGSFTKDQCFSTAGDPKPLCFSFQGSSGSVAKLHDTHMMGFSVPSVLTSFSFILGAKLQDKQECTPMLHRNPSFSRVAI
jgi:hypothetical protein